MAIDLTARPTVKIPPAKPVRSKDRDGAKRWARTVMSVPADASTEADWRGDRLTRGSSVELPTGSLIVDADIVGGRYDVSLRIVMPDGSLWVLAASDSEAWAQELRDIARQWLALPARDRVLACAKDFLADHDDDDGPIVVEEIEARRQWIAAMEGLDHIEATLREAGPRYTGADVAALSQEWIDEDFSANDVEEWIDIGVWSPETAAALRDAGLSPADVQAGADTMLDGLDDETRRRSFTDGDPIYGVCNGDTPIDVLIDAAMAVRTGD